MKTLSNYYRRDERVELTKGNIDIFCPFCETWNVCPKKNINNKGVRCSCGAKHISTGTIPTIDQDIKK